MFGGKKKSQEFFSPSKIKKIVGRKKLFLRENISEKYPQEEKARILPAEENFEPKFPGDKRKFYEEILDHLIIELKSVQHEAYPFPVLDDAYCCTYTRLCSLLYSHMHRVT